MSGQGRFPENFHWKLEITSERANRMYRYRGTRRDYTVGNTDIGSGRTDSVLTGVATVPQLSKKICESLPTPKMYAPVLTHWKFLRNFFDYQSILTSQQGRFPEKFPEIVFFASRQISKRISGNLHEGQVGDQLYSGRFSV